jgi:hypothetical protein
MDLFPGDVFPGHLPSKKESGVGAKRAKIYRLENWPDSL